MKTGNWLHGNGNLGILLLRIFVSLRLLYGVIDNILNWEQMIEFSMFLENFKFPFPVVSAVISVYAQFLAAVFILLGFKIRFFSLVMVFNFLIALLFVHLPANDSIEAMTPALAILFICLAFVFTGSEKYSLDNYFLNKNKEHDNSDFKRENPLPVNDLEVKKFSVKDPYLDGSLDH